MALIIQSKTNLKYILIVVILAVLAGGGILGYQYWWLPSQENKMPEIIIKDETAAPVVNRTEAWQRFVQAEQKYSILFPPQFSIRQLEPKDLSPPTIDSVVLKQPIPPDFEDYEASYISIKIQANPMHLSLEQFYDGDPGIDFFGQSANQFDILNVAGRQAFRFDPVVTYRGIVVVIIPLEDSFLVITDGGASYQQGGTFQAILNSIRLP